jgi:hypothetical protein
LKQVGQLTGTELSMENEGRRICITGSNSNDIDNALEKLNQIEIPFVGLPISLVVYPISFIMSLWKLI